MQGKTVVITGATSGIGQVAAEELASKGARIVLIARDKLRANSTLERLRARGGDLKHSVHYADLSRIDEIKRVAGEIASAEPRIDVLINNAGAVFSHRQVTSDGLELTFALNHVAYFVLTHGLRERLLASSPARIINTSSDAHRRGSIDFNDLQMMKKYSAFGAYCRSKLCNILFTHELARRYQGKGVTANCLHPGFVATRFGDQNTGMLPYLFKIGKTFAISSEKGAETLVYLASSADVASVTGKYFYKCRPDEPQKAAMDDDAAARLWKETVRLTGVDDR